MVYRVWLAVENFLPSPSLTDAADNGKGEAWSKKPKSEYQLPYFPSCVSSYLPCPLHFWGRYIAKVRSSFDRDIGFVRKSSAPAALNRA